MHDRLEWLRNGGGMAGRIRAHDWSRTSLGPVGSWPQSLRTAVGIMLSTRHPVFIFWGPAHACLYNDAYAASLGPEKHPAILGMPGRDAFPEAWPLIGPQIDQVMGGGEPTWHEDHLIPITRYGRREDVYWTYSYGPIDEPGAPNGVGGVLVLCTETTRSVVARRVSEERFRVLAEASSQVFFRMSPDWSELRQLSGGGFLADTREPSGNWGWMDAYIHPEDRERGRAAIDEAIRTRSPLELEHRVRRADGTLGWTLSRAVPILDAEGRITEWFGAASDVTARRNAKEALRRSEARLAAIFTRAAVGLSEVAPDGRFLRVNDELCRLLGRPREELLGLKVTDVTHPDDVPASLASMERALRTVETVSLDKRYRRPDGSLLWANSSLTFIEGDGIEGTGIEGTGIAGSGEGQGGMESRFLAVTVDLTARREAEAALRESEARFRLMAEVVPPIIWITDAEGRVEFLSRKWEDYTGGAERPATVDAFAERIHPDDVAPTMERFDEARRTGGTFITEHRLRAGDGGYRWFLVRGEPYGDPGGGQPLRWFGASVDIDGLKEAEASLRASNEEAERARAEAEAANAAKTRFLGAVSHDLRQPVQAAKLFIGIMKQQPLDPAVRDLLNPLADSIANLSGMLEGLLQGARLEAGLMQAKIREFELDDLLHRLHGEFEVVARKSRLRLWVPPARWTVSSDPLLVELILRNLLSNAIKFTEEGGVTVETREQDGMVEVSVIDTGRGIPADQIGRVFEEYHQVGEAAVGRDRGFGIGLSTVRRVADVLGAALEIRSEPGRGSTFTVRLPLARQAAAETPEAGAPGAFAGRSAIVIDDEPLILKGMELTLRAMGFEVHAASTVGEAASLLDGLNRNPDAVVADYGLARGEVGTDAIALARRRNPAVAAVLVTGETAPERLAEARRSGYSLLHKPVDPDRLRDLLAALMPAGRLS
ncbi:PAS domain S-box protein [Azospirillum sp. SYSU D00513]|uniref:PAS domain S-box protein n=1 Tax=Azospirillum sp. SYSU D00513 TaxID=2812561 RepID=UPI001FFFFC78|nr:PAS domain S-box protein [Azospirillum sp. SYSU D00513]